MNKKEFKQIIFSIVFIILFGIIFGTQLSDLIDIVNNNRSTYTMVLTILAMIVSAAGIYVSLLFGIVKVLNSTKKNSGGKKNGKKK